MKVRVLDQKAFVYSAASLASEVVAEVRAGDEIDVGKTVRDGGATWVATHACSAGPGRPGQPIGKRGTVWTSIPAAGRCASRPGGRCQPGDDLQTR